jgi:ribonuclease G
MDRTIYILPDACAVSEDNRLVEYLPSDPDAQSGDILIARIGRIMAGLECAFADIGRRKSGFLPLAENSSSFQGSALHSGELTAVQIRREENGTKGAFLSRDLSIPGEKVILMPMNRYIGVSNRITEPEERDRLRNIGQVISNGEFGLILRASAADADESSIRKEAETLFRLWQDIEKRIPDEHHPGTVLFSGNPVQQLMDDYHIHSGDPVIRINALPADLAHQFSSVSARKIALKSGGNIVIDPCEALTVIDVNSASYAGSGTKEASVTAANLEACDEAAIQIRLRNITGIILIDFIDMERETDRSLILERLQNNFSRDRRKTVIHGWTKLGLMEMTRKRV